MVWDMQIDRGSTTLSVWTRSRGAYVYPLPTGVLHPNAHTDINTDRDADSNSHCNSNWNSNANTNT